jgi:hypothetical protein
MVSIRTYLTDVDSNGLLSTVVLSPVQQDTTAHLFGDGKDDAMSPSFPQLSKREGPTTGVLTVGKACRADILGLGQS